MPVRPTNPSFRMTFQSIRDGKFQGNSQRIAGSVFKEGPAYAREAANRINNRDDERDPYLMLHLEFEVPIPTKRTNGEFDYEMAQHLANCEWAVVVPYEEPEPEPMVARIPGTMRAVWKDGKIERVFFSPAAADAGYQGGSFEIESNGETWLDDEDDRPFWLAMERYLADYLGPDNGNVAGPHIEWEG